MKDLYSSIFLNSILIFVVFLWLIHIFNYYFVLNFHELGIFQGRLEGLFGILFSPLVHSANHNHIINNSFPFLILGWSLFYFYKPIAWRVYSFLGFLLVY